MSENTQREIVSRNVLTREMIAEMLANNFEKLPDIDQKLFMYGPTYLAGNSGIAGIMSNSFYRKALNISQGPFASTLPMAVLPFLTTFAMYSAAVSAPLLSGDLNCPSCVLIRGALVGVVGGAVYPVLLALPVNMGLASRYNTAPMPERGNVLQYWINLTSPIMRRMRAVVVIQALFGAYLGSKQFDSYTKLARITFGSGEEELKD